MRKNTIKKDIIDALKEAGIERGDSVFVHSNLQSFGKLSKNITKDEFLESFVEALTRVIGKKGNIIMPTFSYSFCKDELFDPDSTPSTVGILTEYFRKKSEAKRSIDPIFSVAAIGPDKEYFTDVGTDCFGKKSIFEKMYHRKVKIIFLGKTEDLTFLHFVEQKFKVPYRYFKKFSGKIKIKKKIKEFTFNYNVRHLNKGVDYDHKKIMKYIEDGDMIKSAPLGYSKIIITNAVDVFNILTVGLKENVYFMLKQKPFE